MQKLIMLVGISGSGKSSYIRSHFIPEVVVSPDELRKKLSGDISDQSQNSKIWGMVPGLLKQKMEQYGKAVLDATNVDSRDRQKILSNFDSDDIEKIAIIFEISPEEAKKRIHSDIENKKDRSQVPDDIIDKQYIKFKNGFNNIKNQFDKIIYGNKSIKEESNNNIIGELPKYGDINIGYKFKDGDLISYRGTHVDQNLYNLIKKKGLTDDQFDKMFGNHRVEGGWTDYQGNFYTNAKEALEMKQKMNENVRLIVRRELSKALREDAQEEMEKASYQAYNDMYLVPQSNWRVKTSDVNMYDDKGFLHKGQIGEVHKLSTIEYDFMHEGEVVTECDGKTYTVNSEDFKNGFEKVNDEEGVKVNNESIVKKEKFNIKEDIKKLSSIKDYYGKNIKEVIERLEKRFINEWEYEDSDGQISDPEEYDNNKQWTPVFSDYYFNDSFTENDLITLIDSDDEGAIMVSKNKEDKNSVIISFKKMKIWVDMSDFQEVVHNCTANGLIEYDSEGNDDFYYFTEKGNQFAGSIKYDLKDTLKKIKKNN